MDQNEINQPKQDLRSFLDKAKKFTDENEPIYAGCPNKECFCTGACRKVIGYRKKTEIDFRKIEWKQQECNSPYDGCLINRHYMDGGY